MNRNDTPEKFNKMCSDIKCKANSVKIITRRVCRNNCKEWFKNKCGRGY